MMRREVEGRLISVDFTLVILATDFFTFGAVAFLTLFFGAVALTVGVGVVTDGINSLGCVYSHIIPIKKPLLGVCKINLTE